MDNTTQTENVTAKKKEKEIDLKKEVGEIKAAYIVHFKNYASWLYPRSKEVRDVMSLSPFCEAMNESILELLLNELIKDDRVAKKWLLLFKRNLSSKIEELHQRTGMRSTETTGLQIDPDMQER